MKVILKRDVKGLGREGDLKEVKDGYARNLLLPTGAAVLADKGAVANWERHSDQREERDRSARAPSAEATAEKLRELKLEIPVKAGERGRLFGAVTAHQIADAISQEGIELDRHALHLREPIKALGEYRIDVRVMPGRGGRRRRQRGGRRVLTRGRLARRPGAGRGVEAGLGGAGPGADHGPLRAGRPSTSRSRFASRLGAPMDVRAYVSAASARRRIRASGSSEPIVDGDRAAIPWWASLREDGADTTLAGTSVLRFDADGLVIEQWDAWNQLRRAARAASRPGPFPVRDSLTCRIRPR